MSDHKPFAYYDTLHDKLLWAEGPQYVHAQRTEGMSLKPLYLHPPRPEPEAEPIYLARRKGLDDFFTCSKDRYDELSILDLFETKIAYLHPPRPEPARKPMNGDEVLEAFCKADISGLQSFTEGVRCAEEFHGIGGDDE